MNIALVNHLRLHLPRDGRPVQSGSIGHFYYEVATRLAARGETVTVYSPKGGRVSASEEEHRGVTFVGLPTQLDETAFRGVERLHRLFRRPKDPKRPLFASRVYHAGYAFRVAADARRRGCDAVHVTNYAQYAPAIRARNPQALVQLHMQCEWLTQLDASLVERRLRACDRFSGCSDYVVDGIRERFPGHAAKGRTLYNGCDVEKFAPPPSRPDGPPRIVFTGRISPEKGVHDLVEAFGIVAREHPEARLELIGGRRPAPYELVVAISDDPLVRELGRFYEGSYEEQLRGLVTSEIAERINFRGNLTQEEVARELHAATVFCHPSAWHEPFGMTITEAMASGLPVVCTRGGGIPEFVEHGKTGLLVERGAPEELASALLELIGDAERRRAMGAAARAKVESELTWDHTTDGLLQQLASGVAAA